MSNTFTPNLSFIIPIKNEGNSLKTLYKEIRTVLKPLDITYEVIFIDDGSTDNSLEILKRIKVKDKNLKIIKLRGNWGKSIALQTGFEIAKGKIIFTMDGDLQDNPEEIPNFLKKIEEGYDLVSGWKKKRKDPISKTLPSYVINKLVNISTGLTIHDINCGYKAYTRNVVQSLNLYGDLYRFIPVIAHKQNFKVGEIVVAHRARKFGKSKFGWGRFISGWLDLLTVFFLTRYLRRPGHFFGGLGILSFTIGFVIGAYIAFLRVTTGSIQFHQPLLMFGLLLMIIGVQLISTGLVAELVTNLNYQKSDISKYVQEIID